MTSLLGGYSAQLYALARIVFGFLFLQHGMQKWFGVLEGTAREFGTLLWFAGLVEFVGGLLIMLGFRTSWVAFIASGQMAFAYFLSHYPRAPLPILNGGEPAVLFCFAFLYMASRGSGLWSVDGLLKKT